MSQVEKIGQKDASIRISYPFSEFKKKCIMNEPTDRPTNGRTDPLIEMRRLIQKLNLFQPVKIMSAFLHAREKCVLCYLVMSSRD